MLRHIQTQEEAIRSVCEEYKVRSIGMIERLHRTQQREAVQIVNRSGQVGEETRSFWSRCRAEMEDIKSQLPGPMDDETEKAALLAGNQEVQNILRRLMR